METNTRYSLRARLVACLSALLLVAGSAAAQEYRDFSGPGFNAGTLINLELSGGALQIPAGIVGTFPFINVAASGRGTMVRINTETGAIIGEYRTAPNGYGLNPSRTTVDKLGNVWIGNRDEQGGLTDPGGLGSVAHGSAVKIGLVVGGTRMDALGAPDAGGQYLHPPFDYNTCIDRNGDGLIKTSRGLGDILAWNAATDGAGGADGAGDTNADGRGVGTVLDAEDECILVYQRMPGAWGVRHVSVDRNNDVWVGGYPYTPLRFYRLDGVTGEVMDGFNSQTLGCGGYGGLVDANGVLWSAGLSQNNLLRYDPATHTGACIGIPQSYGLGVDSHGYIWNATWTDNRIAKLSGAGIVQAGFPRNPGGFNGARGVAVTFSDDNVWVAQSYGNTVKRLNNAGDLLATIGVGDHPTGVAVDNAGKVWVTNYNSWSVMRIDPATNSVDLTVALGNNAYPYNYSDMTGAVVLGASTKQGFWSIVHDGGRDGIVWEHFSWNSTEPAGTSVSMQARAADDPAALSGLPWNDVTNGPSYAGKTAAAAIAGRYVELLLTLTQEPSAAASPSVQMVEVSVAARACAAAVVRVDDFDADQGASDGQEWVRITHDEDAPVVFSGCHLAAILGRTDRSTFTTPLAGIVAPGEALLVGSAAVPGVDVVIPDNTLHDARSGIYVLSVPMPKGTRPLQVAGNVLAGVTYYDEDNWYSQYPAPAAPKQSAGVEALIASLATVADAAAEDVPAAFTLEQNYPNPFNPSTEIVFTLPEAVYVELAVFDLTGRRVATLVSQPMEAGRHAVGWDGRSTAGRTVSSGMYLYRMEAGGFTATRRLMLVR